MCKKIEFNKNSEFEEYMVKFLNSKSLSKHEAQCAAVAYRLLYKQIEGSSLVDFEAEKRQNINNVVLGCEPIEAYTATIIDKIQNLFEEKPLLLTDFHRSEIPILLEDAKYLSYEIARKYSLPQETLDEIESAYEPVVKTFIESDGNINPAAKECHKVLKNNSLRHDVGRLGIHFLDSYLSLNGTDPSWEGPTKLMRAYKDGSCIILGLAEAADVRLGNRAIVNTAASDMAENVKNKNKQQLRFGT